jgi:NADH:ubiquinone oxidoreductase subunit 4 (subunit M)
MPESASKGAAMGIALLTLLASLPLWFGFDPAGAAYQFEESFTWIEAFGVKYHVGIDGVSLLLVLLTTALVPIIVAAGFSGVEKGHRAYFALMLALSGIAARASAPTMGRKVTMLRMCSMAQAPSAAARTRMAAPMAMPTA